MLVSARGRANGPAFLLGWIMGVGGAGALLLVIASGARASNDGQPADWVSWLRLVLGVGLLLIAARQWHGRPAGDEEPPFSSSREWPRSPRRVSLRGQQAVALLVFTVIASISVAAPVLVYFARDERSAEPLGRLKAWMTQNNAVIMAVLLVVIGVKPIGDAIAGLST